MANQDAVALLKEDHRTVEDLFAKFEKASGDDRKKEIADQICMELTVHAMIEEEIFYPACEGKVEEDLLSLLRRGYHADAVMAIADSISRTRCDLSTSFLELLEYRS